MKQQDGLGSKTETPRVNSMALETTPMQSSHIPKSTLRHNLPTIMTITTVLLLATIIPIAIVYSRPKPSEQSCNPTMNLGTTYTPPATLSNITFTTSPIPSNLLWPKPRSVTSGETTLVIDPWMFELELKRTSPRLQRAFGRFVERFAAVGCRGEGEKMKVMVELESGDEVAIADAAESYSLVVDKDGVVIKAENTVVLLGLWRRYRS
ncbi:hypothetical protein BC829DRAFT_230844 [Chytridium lagenaria]|nr:hypothetical protein BC829DRAFT_230844 [Chytridium lagenaria]